MTNRIDFEAHYYFPELMDYFSTRTDYPMYDRATRTFRRSDDFTLRHPYRLTHLEESLDERIRIMDAHGVRMQVLSVSSGIDFLVSGGERGMVPEGQRLPLRGDA